MLIKYAEIVEPFSFIPVAGPIIFSSAKISKTFGNQAINLSNSKSNDLNEIREKIDNFLREQNHKIIIIIDDIDRLYNDEIRLIFQLIKSVGDFPNTIYLISFDHDVVINALKTVQDCPGEKYLEKVVEISESIESNDIRVDIDDRASTLQKKVRDAEKEWIPYIIVIGPKEVELGSLSVRDRENNRKVEKMKLPELIAKIQTKIHNKPFHCTQAHDNQLLANLKYQHNHPVFHS